MKYEMKLTLSTLVISIRQVEILYSVFDYIYICVLILVSIGLYTYFINEPIR